jgi:hypothetical protein
MLKTTSIPTPVTKLPAIRKIPGHVLVLFFVWPFAAFLKALGNYRAPWAPNVFMYFAAFLGFTFVLYEDAERVNIQLITLHHGSLGLVALFTQYFADDSGMLDIIYPLITFFVAMFTDDYRFLFAILAFTLAYFITRSLWFLFQRITHKVGIFDGLILIAFALTVQIWYIGGRWNLAAAIFFFGLLNYFYYKETRYLWLAGASVFVHWSFFIALPVFFIYKFFRNRTLIFFILFVTSFFFSFVEIEAIRDLFENYTPTAVMESRGSYLKETTIDARQAKAETVNWYVFGHIKLLNWFLLAAGTYLFLSQKNLLKGNKPLFNLFNFSLLFFGVFNAISYVPSVGRFLVVGQLMFLSVLFLFIQESRGRFHPLLRIIGQVVLIVFIIVRLRIGADGIGLWIFTGNPLLVYFLENKIALIDIIKSIL